MHAPSAEILSCLHGHVSAPLPLGHLLQGQIHHFFFFSRQCNKFTTLLKDTSPATGNIASVKSCTSKFRAKKNMSTSAVLIHTYAIYLFFFFCCSHKFFVVVHDTYLYLSTSCCNRLECLSPSYISLKGDQGVVSPTPRALARK
jgi:hypothetical protein